MADFLTLRPISPDDMVVLGRLWTDPEAAGQFEWFGFRVDRLKELERRLDEDGLMGPAESFLAVVLDDGTCAGLVTWKAHGPYVRYEIGIALLPEHRGHGVGTAAQRHLVDYLFATTSVHRLEAGTEVDNLAEQKALEKVGFRREGVTRGVHFRAGSWRDSVIYGLTRDVHGKLAPDPSAP